MIPGRKRGGFTLVELAVVLFVLALLTGGLATSVTAYLENKAYADTRENLERAAKALVGYTLDHGGAFPWADVDGDGVSDTGRARGNLPWKSLGLSRRQGLDAWMQPLGYHRDDALEVRDLGGNALTLPGGAVAVLWSPGADHADYAENGDGDAVYVQDGPVEGVYDDEVTWIPSTTLYETWAHAADVLRDSERAQLTLETMRRIQGVLIGHALLNGGKLPAADTDGDGRADSGRDQGTLPWRTLGLTPTEGRDAWNRPFRYHVDTTYRSGSGVALPDTSGGIRVFDSSGNALTPPDPNGPVALLLSFGVDGDAEGDNGDGDGFYTADVVSAGVFDDLVTWLSRPELLDRLAAARVWP